MLGQPSSRCWEIAFLFLTIKLPLTGDFQCLRIISVFITNLGDRCYCDFNSHMKKQRLCEVGYLPKVLQLVNDSTMTQIWAVFLWVSSPLCPVTRPGVNWNTGNEVDLICRDSGQFCRKYSREYESTRELQAAMNDWITRHSGWKKTKCGKKQL